MGQMEASEERSPMRSSTQGSFSEYKAGRRRESRFGEAKASYPAHSWISQHRLTSVINNPKISLAKIIKVNFSLISCHPVVLPPSRVPPTEPSVSSRYWQKRARMEDCWEVKHLAWKWNLHYTDQISATWHHQSIRMLGVVWWRVQKNKKNSNISLTLVVYYITFQWNLRQHLRINLANISAVTY